MAFLKNTYSRLPVWMQSAAVTLFSLRNSRLKYGRVFHDTLAQLAGNETRSLPELREVQTLALHRMLTYANRHVPHYRALRCPPDDLSAWPVLEKSTVKENPLSFLSDEFQPHDLMTLKTSGTTGTPMQVKITREYHQVEMAFRWRHKAWAGVPYLSRSAYLSGHPVVPGDQSHPPFWRIDPVEKRMLCSSYHLTQTNLPYYVQALADYDPDFIHGYPSSLYVLSHFILREGITDFRPRAVFTASETLMDFQRSCIEKALGVRVFNWYGNTEMTCNLIQCHKGSLHYRTDYGVLEVLDDGSMVCTGLNNQAMPFIRYRIGDRVTLGNHGCVCGCEFPVVSQIEGRVEDYVLTPDGRQVGRLDHLLKDVVHVREAQILQTQLEELIVRVVPTEDYTSRDEQTLLQEARSRLGPSMEVRIDYVKHIPRGPGGKFQFIVSQLPESVRQGRSVSPSPVGITRQAFR